jgi:hypothetical protein
VAVLITRLPERVLERLPWGAVTGEGTGDATSADVHPLVT